MTVPAVMKAMILTGHGGPEKLEYVQDFPTPSPGPGEVLLQVHACGVNNTDIWVREGAYGTQDNPDDVSSWRRDAEPTLIFPRIQGADTVGNIVAVGDGVDDSRLGHRVMVDFSIYNTESDSLAHIDYIGHGRDGGFAEYCVVPDENAHVVATDMSDTELATFCCAYLTGEHLLNRARVTSGENVLVTGASGGVGSGLIQLCRARDAVPYAIVGKGKERYVLDIGAEAVITREQDDFEQQVKEVMGGKPVDVVADLVAGPLFKPLINLLRPEGRYATAGAIAGPQVEFDLRTIYLKHLEIHGSSQGTRGEFQDLIKYIEAKKIKPLLAATYPLSELHRAQADFIAKRFIGKLVVVPDQFYQASPG